MSVFRVTPDGVRLVVRATPRADRDAVTGVEETTAGPAIGVRVRAVPNDGDANEAISRVLADALGVPRRAVTIERGGANRLKTIHVAGDPATLTRRLEDLG